MRIEAGRGSARRQLVQALGAGALAAAAWGHAAQQGKAKRWRVAEIRAIGHASLEADAKGFRAGLASAGIQEGRDVEILRLDAGGDALRLRQLAHQLAQQPYDIVHTIATHASQEVVRAGGQQAVVFSSVTDPVFAQLVPSNSAPGQGSGTFVTGVSDMWPVDMQLRTYASMVPDAHMWGTLYNPAESNAMVQVTRMQAAAQRMGLQLLEAKLRNASEVEQVTHTLLTKVQALVLNADNTSISRIATIAHLCDSMRVPLFAGDIESVAHGAVAAYGLDYFLVGYAAGRKAALVLKGMPVGSVPWGPMEKFSFVLNQRAAHAQGVQFTAGVLGRADKVLFADADAVSAMPAPSRQERP